MPISTYAELQTEVADWLHQDNLTTKITTFIQLGEDHLNRKLRTVDMETRGPLTASTSSRFLSLPTGLQEAQSLFILDPRQEIEFVEASVIGDLIETETTTGIPKQFTVKDEIEFNCIPDQAYSLEMHYFKKYDLATDSTNWLLTNYPETYLYSSIVSASVYIMNDERVPGIKSMLDEMIRDINKQEARKRGSSIIQMRTEVVSSGAYDIIRSY